MPESLPIQPSYGVSSKVTANVIRVEFGDGYSQRTARGTNAIKRSWSLLWEGLTSGEVQSLESFFASLGGCAIFLWQAPGDSGQRKWTCASWSKTPVAPGVYNLSAEIQEEVDP